MHDFQTLLHDAVLQHGHLCAGQVLGVRMAQCALRALDVDVEREPKRVIVYVEIDRCAADAVASVARVSLGKRTLKYVDYGKMAATFVDTQTGRAVRVAALDDARERAAGYAPRDMAKHDAQLVAYQQMPERELFNIQAVRVQLSEFDLPGHPLRRVACARCGEGVNDARDVVQAGETLCRACAGAAYYVAGEERPPASEPTGREAVGA
ncbi:MAG: TraR/DksA C4-type zinc finger protein [Chloroflexi bacterium]|nr:TraR/DksA C4-type zinc finger protein [Chloroflexota bacterium]